MCYLRNHCGDEFRVLSKVLFDLRRKMKTSTYTWNSPSDFLSLPPSISLFSLFSPFSIFAFTTSINNQSFHLSTITLTIMCQSEDSTTKLSEECIPLLRLSQTQTILDPSDDESSWTSRLSKSKFRISNTDSNYDVNEIDGATTAPWTVILFGQSIAVALAIGNFSISSLENKFMIRLPALTMSVVYLILSLHLVYLFTRQQRKRRKNITGTDDNIDGRSRNRQTLQMVTKQSPEVVQHYFPFTNYTLQTPWQAYLLLAILDVEANYLTMLSFQHTSLSSSMLLTSLSVFSTLLFRRCAFGKSSASYSYKKILGVCISVIGACLWIHKDFESNFTNDAILSSNNVLYGDALAFASALLYGLNDVLLEYTVKSNNNRIEYLGMIGMFGFLFSIGIQVPILERDELSNWISLLNLTENVYWGLILLFVLVMSYFYIAVTVFLSVNDATILNLSLQASPLWAVILATCMAHGEGGNGSTSGVQLPPMAFFVALSMVVSGMYLYESRPVKNEVGWLCYRDNAANNVPV